MKFISAALLFVFLFPNLSGTSRSAVSAGSAPLFGFRNSSDEMAREIRFMVVPDPKLAEEHLRILTQAPHMAGTPEDKATADYVAQKFRDAGLETEIVEYRVWMNYPAEVSVDVTAPAGVTMHGPARERVSADPYQDDPRVVMPFNSMSPSGDVEAEVVYANYGTPDDFQKLEQMKIDVRGKLILVRYGQNFRGVKAFVAQEHGAAGVLIYSDPADDGWRHGDKYPQGPWRPDTGVQRGSIGYMFQFPGDPTTPGIASLPSLPDSKRTPPEQSAQLPKIPTTPISYADAWPILEHLGGPDSPRDWQGSLPFTYHVGPGPVTVKMHLKQDYQLRTIWDVIGRIRGSQLADELVVAGNHRDAWVYGAVDPNSGTAAMLESIHGIGELLKSGWKPKRTIIFGSWDAEEEGLIGSTEWGEQHEAELANAVAYFNMDVAVSGSKFGASSVPTLKQFLREVTKVVPGPKGGMLYDDWRKTSQAGADPDRKPTQDIGGTERPSRRAEQIRYLCRRSGKRLRLHRVPSASGRALVRRELLGIVRRLSFRLRQLQLVQEIWRSLISSTSRRWRVSSALKPFAWRKPTFCPTTTKNTEKKLLSISTPPEGNRRMSSAASRLIFPRRFTPSHQFEQAGAKMLRRQKNPGTDATQLNAKPASGGTRLADS